MKNNEPAEVHAKPSSGTYPSPAPQTQNQGQHERFPGGQGSQIGCGLISILITSTDFADKATVEKKTSALDQGSAFVCAQHTHQRQLLQLAIS